MSYNIEQANSGFLSLTAAGLAEGTNANTFKTVNTLTFTNNGVFKSKAATDNLTFSSGHTALAASQACLFGIWINASGTVTTTQGPIVAAGDPCPVPSQATANTTLVGLIKVTTRFVYHVHSRQHRPRRFWSHRRVLRLHGYAWLSPVICCHPLLDRRVLPGAFGPLAFWQSLFLTPGENDGNKQEQSNPRHGNRGRRACH
jgi:hypothetical protein